VNSGGFSAEIQLSPGSNIISAVVTAQDTSITKTYQVTVTRLSATAALPNPVMAWGAGATNTGTDPEFGQSMVPNSLSGGTTAVSGGLYHSVALKNDGTVVAWGRNVEGQTNTGGLSGVSAIAAGGDFTVALRSDDTVVALGDNFNGQTNVPAGLSGVTAIAAGGDHAVALKSDGTVATRRGNGGPISPTWTAGR